MPGFRVAAGNGIELGTRVYNSTAHTKAFNAHNRLDQAPWDAQIDTRKYRQIRVLSLLVLDHSAMAGQELPALAHDKLFYNHRKFRVGIDVPL